MRGMQRLCATASAGALALASSAHAQTTQTDANREAGSAASAEAFPVDQEPAKDIIVTGLRRSLGTAEAIKRNSDNIVDSVVAEDIGKLPDNNATEAVSRVTGVQVSRSEGEANSVLIRGLPQVETTLNGRNFFFAGSRSGAVQDFPADTLSAVSVYKTSTANLLESGVGGLIDVQLRRPFDIEGFRIAGGLRGTFDDQSRKYDPIGNLLISSRWETGIGEVGVLINGAYTRRHYLDSIRFDDVFRTTTPAATVLPVGLGPVQVPVVIGAIYNRGVNARPSINGSVQWKPNADLEIYADGLWQGFRGRYFGSLTATSVWYGDPTLTDVTVVPGTNVADTATYVPTDPNNGVARNTTVSTTNTFQFGGGVKYQAGNVKLTTDLAYTDSTNRNHVVNVDTSFAQFPTVTAQFHDKNGASFNYSGIDIKNVNSYIFRGLYDQRAGSRGKSWQWRGDADIQTEGKLIRNFQFGLRYSDRDASSYFGDRYAYLVDQRIPLSQLPGIESGGVVRRGFRGTDVQPVTQWFAPSTKGVRDNLPALIDFVRRNGATNYAGDRPTDNPVSGYRSNEKLYSVYAQLRYEADVGFPIDGVAGTRITFIDQTLNGFGNITLPDNSTQLAPIEGNPSYTVVLPNASARARFTDKLQLRLSYAQTVTLPGFGDLNPSLTLGTTSTPIRGSGGNPNLRPVTSDNYDASLEYYFSHNSYLSLAGFYKKIDGFINRLDATEIDPTFGQVIVSRPRNASAGKVKGIEASYQTFFDFLPGALSGFGTQVNATYIKVNEQITGVSKWTYNLIGFYEKGPVSARLAYNRRSRYIQNFVTNQDTNLLQTQYAAPVSRLDFSASVTPVEQVTITFDVANILAQPFRNYIDSDLYPRDVRVEGRVFSLGARFRL